MSEMAYFVAGYPSLENIDYSDTSAIIETVINSDAYHQCMDNLNLRGFQIVSGPYPYLEQAQTAYPDATELVRAIDFKDDVEIAFDATSKYVNAIPVSILIIGIIVIALTHGKVKK